MAMAMMGANRASTKFGRGCAWVLTAILWLAAVEVYLVEPELASIGQSLRFPDMALGLMSASTQLGVGDGGIPLITKTRMVVLYLAAVFASLGAVLTRRHGGEGVVARVN